MAKTALNRGTLEELRARTSSRREAARERDDERFKLADELSTSSRVSIAEDKGYLVLPPGSIAEAEPVIAAGNQVVDSIGHDRLLAEYNPRHDTMSRGFLPEEAFQLGSPYMDFALHEDVVGAATSYLGVVPILLNIDIWYAYAPPSKKGPINASLWHLDGDDTVQMKVWIHLNDVVPEAGPLTALDASLSEDFAEHTEYDSSVEYRIPDEKINAFITDDDLVTFDGPRGQIDFCDTSRCFHMGSRAQEGCEVRRVFFAKFVTPYSFRFENDHTEKAPFRHLASSSSSELETLVLGAK